MLPNFKTMRDILPKSFDKWLSETFTPKKVIFSGPATIVIFEDGTKVVCKCHKNDRARYSKDRGYLLCILKRFAMVTGVSFQQLYSCFMPSGLTANVEKEIAGDVYWEGYKEGNTRGYEQGYKHGYEDGRQQGRYDAEDVRDDKDDDSDICELPWLACLMSEASDIKD